MRFQMARHLGRLKLASARARRVFRGAVNATALTRASFRGPTPDALPPEFSPTDYVHFLLYIDAEIEHGLMVQYLYAAYSLGGPQVPEGHRPMIQGWREIILSCLIRTGEQRCRKVRDRYSALVFLLLSDASARVDDPFDVHRELTGAELG